MNFHLIKLLFKKWKSVALKTVKTQKWPAIIGTVKKNCTEHYDQIIREELFDLNYGFRRASVSAKT